VACQSARGSVARVFELQEMFDGAADLVAHGIALALAQILDLLGQVDDIERRVDAALLDLPQRRRLLQSPGVIIGPVEVVVDALRHW
jgi:hypothetical protein